MELIELSNSLFKHNQLILKEKGLLIVEQPIRKIDEILISAEEEIGCGDL